MMETKAHLVAVTSRRQAFFYIFSSKKKFFLQWTSTKHRPLLYTDMRSNYY